MEHPPILLGRFSLALVSETSTQYERTARPAAILALVLVKSRLYSSTGEIRVTALEVVGTLLLSPVL